MVYRLCFYQVLFRTILFRKNFIFHINLKPLAITNVNVFRSYSGHILLPTPTFEYLNILGHFYPLPTCELLLNTSEWKIYWYICQCFQVIFCPLPACEVLLRPPACLLLPLSPLLPRAPDLQCRSTNLRQLSKNFGDVMFKSMDVYLDLRWDDFK